MGDESAAKLKGHAKFISQVIGERHADPSVQHHPDEPKAEYEGVLSVEPPFVVRKRSVYLTRKEKKNQRDKNKRPRINAEPFDDTLCYVDIT